MADGWDSRTTDGMRLLVERADGDPAAVAEQTGEWLTTVGVDAPLSEVQAVCAWAFGLASRHLRRLDESKEWLERASASLSPGSADHTGVELTRSSTLTYLGRLDDAVDVLEATNPPKDLEPRVTCQLGTINEFRGELTKARHGYEAAIGGFERNGDAKGVAHALVGLGLIDVAGSESASAISRFGEAVAIYEGLGDAVLAAVAQSNIGYAAAQAHDFATALEHLGPAGEKLRSANQPFAETALEHALVLLNAGIPGEAIEVIAEVLPQLEAGSANLDKAELLIAFGQALSAAGHNAEARRVLDAAHRLFEQQQRHRRVQLVELRTSEVDLREIDLRDVRDDGTELTLRRLVDTGLGLADDLASDLPAAANEALILAGRAASRAGQREPLDEARKRLAQTGTGVRGERLLECLALSLEGRHAEVVDLVLEGMSEPAAGLELPLDLRTAGLIEADELVALGLESALKLRDSESLGAMICSVGNPALDHPSLRPAADPLGKDLRLALRGSLDAADWRRISEQVRSPAMNHEINAPGQVGVREVPAGAVLLAAVGSSVVVVRGAQIDTHDRSSIEQRLVRHRDLLATAVLNRGTGLGDALEASASSIRATMPWLDDSRLALVPVGDLALFPWSSVAGGAVRIVAPTLGTPTVGAQARRSGATDIVVVGPGTATAALEASEIREALANHQVVIAEGSTELVLQEAGGSDVLHLACHAVHHDENPLLSSYLLVDGHLRGYEIERLGRAPRVVISSACSAGRQATRGSMHVLGLPTTWLKAGADQVLAPYCAIPDDARTTDTLVEIHRLVSSGLDVDEAVVASRELGDDLVARTLVSFIRSRPAALTHETA